MLRKSLLALAVCVLLLAASHARADYPVLDTGDPDERVCNPKSYSNLGNGTIYDSVTGLQWQQATKSTESTWFYTESYSENFAGYSDWRIPTVQELTTLVDSNSYGPAIDSLFGMATETQFWSSLPRAVANTAWVVDFLDGSVYDENKTHTLSIRPVRGPYYAPEYDFVIHADGTVSDLDTGLMWQSGSAGPSSWSNAAASIESLNDAAYLGYEDWRLPTRNELQSLFDYSYSNPATGFPNTGSVKYWSSTSQSNNANYAWYADFEYGRVYSDSKSSSYYVRAVRSGSCLAECLTDEHCDDGLFCNGEETCLDGACLEAAMPCSSPLVCDEGGDQCVQCLEDTDCDDSVVCNGEETCESKICVAGTTTCAAEEYCDEQADECVECLINAHCDNGLFCDGTETCVLNVCVDGVYPCAAGEFCEEQGDGRCVECFDVEDCPDDSLWCTGPPLCDDGMCGFEEQCPGEQCNETSRECVECLTDDHCDNGAFCDGVEQCIDDACFYPGTDPCAGDDYCDESTDACVECLNDTHCASGYACFSGTCAPGGFLWISKVKVKAGKVDNTDSMQLQGQLDAAEADFFAALGNVVTVSLAAEYIPDGGEIEFSFPIEAGYLSKGKYSSPKIKSADKSAPVTSLAIDTNKGTMKFSAKNVDLTGLACPIICRVTIGDNAYIAEMIMNEGLVNGTKKPCPLPLLMGVYGSLVVEKVKAKKSTKTASDSISISGTFTIDGEFDMNEPIVIMIGSDELIVSATAFIEKNGSYSCKSYDSGNGFVSAKFDTAKCVYSIKIKNAMITDSGKTAFKIDLFGNLLESSNQLNLPPDP